MMFVNRQGHEMRRTPRTPALVTTVLLAAAAPPNVSGATLGGEPAAAPGRAELRIRADTLALPPPISQRLSWARSHLTPSGLRRLEQIGRRLAPDIAAGTGFGPLRTRAEHEVVASFPKLGGADVADAAFIVLAMATEDLDEDIRTILPEVNAADDAKVKLRDTIAALNAWISREMGYPSDSEDLDGESAGSSVAGGRRPTPGVPAGASSRVRFEVRTSPVAGIRHLHVSTAPPLPARTAHPALNDVRALRDAHVATLAELEPLSAEVLAGLRRLLEYRTKIVAELSNLMAKVTTTQDTLVQNVK